MWRWHADSLSNDSTFFFMYMMNCASANPDVESIAKNFMRNPNGGAVALVGNQIFAGPTNGLRLEEAVFELMFTSDNLSLGAVTTIPRQVYAFPTSSYPWWTYLNSILYGDPCIRIWEGTPQSLDVSAPSSMTLGDSVCTVTVEDGGAGVEGAVVVLAGGHGEYGAAVTDASGTAEVGFRPRGTGEVEVVVTCDGYLPEEGGLSVTGSGGRLYVSSVSIDDEDGGTHMGNGDGEAGWGERVGLGVGVANGGTGSVSDVSCTLSPVTGCSLEVDIEFTGPAEDPPVYIGGACMTPPSIPFGLSVNEEALGRCTRDFGEEDACWVWLDSRGWHVRLNANGDSGFAYRCSLEVHGEIAGYIPGHLEPGDELIAGDGYFLFTGELSENDFEEGFDFQSGHDGGVTVHDGSEAYGSIGSAEVMRFFDVEFASGRGEDLPAWFEVVMEDGGGNEWVDWLPVTVGDGCLRVERFSGFGHAPYDFTIGVRNTGGGGLTGVAGTARAVTGIVILDSTSAYGDLAAGEYADGSEDEYTYAGPAGSAVIEIEFRDAFGRSWLDTVYERSVDAPGGLTYAVGDGYIDLRWDVSEDDLLSHYEVYRADDAYGAGGGVVGIVEGHSRFVDYDVDYEEDYYYKVRAVDVMGNTAPGAESEVWSGAPYLDGFPAEIRGAAWSSPVSG